jgi:hypothetical protein
MSLRQFAPPVFVAGAVGLSVLSFFVSQARMLLALLMGAYAAANLAASLITSLRGNLRSMPYLSLAYGILHFSYGAGFLYGLVKFINRWKTAGAHEK